MNNPKYSARLVGSAADIGEKKWNACANPTGRKDPHPFTRYEFFAALEESGAASPRSGWQPCHLVLDRQKSRDALMPLYLKSHSQGEYVFDHGWADAFERAGGRYYPKLQASVPFTPVTGRRLLLAKGVNEKATQTALLTAGETATKQIGASSLHITFLTSAEWDAAGEVGYLCRTDQQFHWQNRG